MKKITTKEFIKRAIEVHGAKYDYSLVDYKTSHKKVKIICRKHGMFKQMPSSHWQGKGCIYCRADSNKEKFRSNTKEFIKKAKNIHGDKYDYSLVDYSNARSKIKIICPKHGPFKQIAHSHLIGYGCRKCGTDKAIRKQKSSTKGFIKKAIKIHDNKYDYSLTKYKSANTKIKIICPDHGIFEQLPGNHLNNKGCIYCSGTNKKTTSNFISSAIKIHGNKYDYSLVRYKSAKIKVDIICKKHGVFSQIPRSHIRGQGCPKCGHHLSINEEKILKYIKKYKIKAHHNKRDIIPPKEIDIYIPDYNIGIEVNGLRWHSEQFKINADYHLTKTIACQKKGIRLLHFWDFEINEKFDIVKSIILNTIGKTPNKIYARKLTVDCHITTKEAKTFCEQNHIHGFRGGRYKIGLRDNNNLVSLMITGSDGEMVRFASKINTNVVGGFSRLLKYSPVTFSFVDRRLFNGSGYINNGFKIEYSTRPNYFYEHNGIYAGSRQQFQKHKLKDKLEVFNPDLTEVENMANNDYYRVFDCGNYKMIYVGDINGK